MKVKLVVVGGKKDGMEIPISTPKFLIGRGNRCHIRPQSNLIGDLHCLISVDSNSVILEDCGGAVGTFVNGKKIQQRHRLQNNDRITIATLEFAVQLIADETAKKPTVQKKEAIASHTPAAPADQGEVDILQWVKQEERIRSSPQEVVTLPNTKPEKKPPKTPVAAPVPQKSDDVWKDIELEPTDLLLLLTVIPLASVLLSFLPVFWAWRGGGAMVLVALAWMFRTRMKRTGGIKRDELNVAIGVLALLIVCLMLPLRMYLLWQWGAVALLMTLSVVVVRRMKGMASNRLDDTNIALLAAVTLLAYTVTKQLPITQWGWLGWSVVALLGLALVLGVRIKGMVERKLDDTNAALLAAISILAFSIVKMWSPAIQWLRLSGAVVPLVALAVLLGIRARRLTAQRLDGLNLLLVAQIGILSVSFLYLMLLNSSVWQVGAVLLLLALIPLLGIRLVWSQESRLNEINLALLLQIVLLGQFVARMGIPSSSQLFALPTTAWWNWPGWGIMGIVILSVVLGRRMIRMPGSRLNDANVALLAAISLLAFMVVKLLPTAAQWVRLSGAVVPLIVLAALFGIRARMAGNRLDRLNVLLLLQIGVFTILVLHFVWPAFSVWQGGVALLLIAFIPLLGIGIVRMRGNRFNEISLALLLQIGALAYFAANWWLPSSLWPFAPRPTTLQLATLPPSTSPSAKLLPNNTRAVPAAHTIANVSANPPANAKPPVNAPAKPPANAIARPLADALANAPAKPPANAPAAPPANALANVPPANAPNKPLGDVPAKAPNKPDANVPADAHPGPPANVPANGPNKAQGEALAERPANAIANAPAGPPAAKVPAANAPIKPPVNAVVNAPANLPPPAPPANPPGNRPAEAAPANLPAANAPPAVPPANAVANAPARPPANLPPGNARAKPPAKPLTTPPPKSPWATQWTGLGSVGVPLVVLISLFGIRTRRTMGGSFDGLGLLLLAQIGIFAVSALHQVLPNLSVWQGGAVFLVLAMIPLLGISMVRTKEGKLNEVNLALLIQIGLLMLFVVQRWLPYQWTRLIVGVILVLALVPFWGIRKAWKTGRRLNEIDLALLAQIGVFAFIIANQWLPSFWVRIGESAILLAGLAIVLWLHEKRLRVGKSDQIILRLVAIGIALIVILGFLFPITSWS